MDNVVDEEELNRMLDRLAEVQKAMWEHQVARIREKFPLLGDYRVRSLDSLLEGLGRNLVQFTGNVISINENGTINQGADILNLTLMAIDVSTEIAKDSLRE